MSTSFVAYRGHGFWSWDGYLEHLLSLLAAAIGDSPDQQWLGDLRDHWRKQSSGVYRGWIHPNLDEFVTGEKHLKSVLALLEDITSRPDLTREVKETARLLGDLLLGRVVMDASSPLDYMVSGPQPYKWSPP